MWHFHPLYILVTSFRPASVSVDMVKPSHEVHKHTDHTLKPWCYEVKQHKAILTQRTEEYNAIGLCRNSIDTLLCSL